MKTLIAGLRDKAKKQGQSVRDWFILFDSDRSKNLDIQELTRVLQHAGVRLPQADVAQLFRLLDASGDGKVSYKEFCDIIGGDDIPAARLRDFAAKERGRTTGQAEEEARKEAEAANIRSLGANIGSSQFSRDHNVGKVEGLSAVMERSA